MNRAIQKDAVKKYFELKRQEFGFTPDLDYTSDFGILTRSDLQQLRQEAGFYRNSTSGTTGEQVTVEKTYEEAVYRYANYCRFISWGKFDTSKTKLSFNVKGTVASSRGWGLPLEIFPNYGTLINRPYTKISEMQKTVDEINPHYIFAFPSAAKELDLSKATNFVSFSGTGEVGADLYSTEELGIVAIKCPDNPLVFHVMEHLIIEAREGESALITSLINPYLKRYEIGDVIELGSCNCGRGHQTIASIKGRYRGMIHYPDGSKAWPTFGSKDFYDKFAIRRYQVTQESVDVLNVTIIRDSPLLGRDYLDFVTLIQNSLGYPFEVVVSYVAEFPTGKFEEFKSMVR